MNGRNFTQLLTLTPGVTPVSTAQNRNVGCCEGNVGLPGSGFSDSSFHGQQNRSKLYFFDGIINTNIRGPTYIVIPNIDAVQEFKVVGHDAKAEFGGATGGGVNMVRSPAAPACTARLLSTCATISSTRETPSPTPPARWPVASRDSLCPAAPRLFVRTNSARW